MLSRPPPSSFSEALEKKTPCLSAQCQPLSLAVNNIPGNRKFLPGKPLLMSPPTPISTQIRASIDSGSGPPLLASKGLGRAGRLVNSSSSCGAPARCTPCLMEMSDLFSLSKHLPSVVSNSSHPESLPHLLFSVLLPRDTTNLLEHRPSSPCPHDTTRNTVGSLSAAGKQPFFFFSFLFSFFFLSKPTRNLTESSRAQILPLEALLAPGCWMQTAEGTA